MLEYSDLEHKILKKYKNSLEIISNMECPLERRKFLKGLYKLYRNDPYVNALAENCLIDETAGDVERIDKITGLEFDIIYEIVFEKCERTRDFEQGSIEEVKYLFGKCKNGMAHSNYAKIADKVRDNYIKQVLRL